jgi:misacylated tRNA(Ala) deacylase
MAHPEQTNKGRVVGDLSCQLDSYLKTLDTEVISCEKAPKHAHKSKKSSRHSHSHDEWLIECADSVLFPEGFTLLLFKARDEFTNRRLGGGQPSDHGTITPLSGSDQTPIPIKNAQRQGLRCIIYSPKPLSPGDRIRQEVDWKRRWDHMQQHTGQHLLSAVMQNRHDLKTLGWGMGAADTMNYVDLQRKPTEEEIQAIQNECAELIRENLPIRVETPDDAKHDKLPGDYDKSDGVVRVIHIGDLDTNT